MSKKPRTQIYPLSSLKSSANTPITSKNLFKSLDYLRDALPGVRAMGYQLMAMAWRIVLFLRKHKEQLEKFKRKAGLKANKGKIADAVMAYVLRATTDSMKRMAWKRSRVLQFLDEQGVKVGKIANEIEVRGGIEAIYKQAVKLMPRRGSKPNKKEAKKAQRPAKKTKKGSWGEPSAEVDDDTGSQLQRTNDQALTIELGLKLSDRDELFEMSKNAKVQLTIKRTNNLHGAQFKVIKIKELIKPASKW